MPRYVAFLRAINVGGRTVKMDQLRVLFADMGLRNVETFIASGNVIFDSPARSATLERKIARHLFDALGYDVPAFLRTPAQLQAIASYNPFEGNKGGSVHATYVGFLHAEPDKAASQRVLALRSAQHDFHVAGRELYWLARISTAESKISGGTIEKLLGAPSTMRNLTTVRALAEKYSTSVSRESS